MKKDKFVELVCDLVEYAQDMYRDGKATLYWEHSVDAKRQAWTNLCNMAYVISCYAARIDESGVDPHDAFERLRMDVDLRYSEREALAEQWYKDLKHG